MYFTFLYSLWFPGLWFLWPIGGRGICSLEAVVHGRAIWIGKKWRQISNYLVTWGYRSRQRLTNSQSIKRKHIQLLGEESSCQLLVSGLVTLWNTLLWMVFHQSGLYQSWHLHLDSIVFPRGHTAPALNRCLQPLQKDMLNQKSQQSKFQPQRLPG